MTTLKRCTSCNERKEETVHFRLRKKKGRPELAARVATCNDCEARKNPDSYWQTPPPLWTYRPYRADPEDKDVRRFRREMAKRRIAREGEGR